MSRFRWRWLIMQRNLRQCFLRTSLETKSHSLARYSNKNHRLINRSSKALFLLLYAMKHSQQPCCSTSSVHQKQPWTRAAILPLKTMCHRAIAVIAPILEMLSLVLLNFLVYQLINRSCPYRMMISSSYSKTIHRKVYQNRLINMISRRLLTMS